MDIKRTIRLAVLMLLVSVGCGGYNDRSDVDISMTSVVWQGSVEKDPSLLNTFDDVSVCLAEYGFLRPGYPEVIVVKDEFLCGDELSRGCVDNSKIYIAEFYLYTWNIFAHEAVHWITRRSNEHHGDSYFIECSRFIPQFENVPPPLQSGSSAARASTPGGSW